VLMASKNFVMRISGFHNFIRCRYFFEMSLSNLNTFRLFRYRIREQYLNCLRRILLNKIEDLIFVDPCIIVQFIKKNPTRCNNVSQFYYSIFIWSSIYFGRHTAHHQEPKTALAASVFFICGRLLHV